MRMMSATSVMTLVSILFDDDCEQLEYEQFEEWYLHVTAKKRCFMMAASRPIICLNVFGIWLGASSDFILTI